MGNAGLEGCSTSGADVREPFSSSGVQQWSIESVEEAASHAGFSSGTERLTITLEQFLTLFPLLAPKSAMRIFKQFSERFSVRDLAKLGKSAYCLSFKHTQRLVICLDCRKESQCTDYIYVLWAVVYLQLRA